MALENSTFFCDHGRKIPKNRMITILLCYKNYCVEGDCLNVYEKKKIVEH